MRLELAGVMAMLTKVALVTVSGVDPEMLPRVAVMVVVPGASVLARPIEPVALLMEATLGAEEVQLTNVVRFCGVLFE